MKRIVVGAMALVLMFVATGCMSAYYSRYDEMLDSDVDTLQVPAMSKQDVIDLTKEGIGDDIIINQLQTTASTFQLNTRDIIDLKKAGISAKVINAMIKTGVASRKSTLVRRAPYYPAYPYTVLSGSRYYYGSSYGHFRPFGLHYYSTSHSGSFYKGHGYGGYYNGGHYSGGGGHRSFGGHR